MTARYNPKTLAKTIAYITAQAPGEFGLFWDPDGTMPWKELYWALQEDSALRFVRESVIRELIHLGLELPFTVEGSRLRWRSGRPLPPCPQADQVPDRLYAACRRKQYAYVLEHGLTPSSRSLLPLAATRELALRLGHRRDPQALLLEVRASSLKAEGEVVHWAGADLYLVPAVPVRYLIFPLLRAAQQAALTPRKQVETKPSRPVLPAAPGSFFVDAQHLDGHPGQKPGRGQAGKQKGGGRNDWKRGSKKERHKRSI